MKRVLIAALIGALMFPAAMDTQGAPVAGGAKGISDAVKAAKEYDTADEMEEPEDVYAVGFTECEFSLMCRVVEAEAGGCSEQCRLWVADVIVNRAVEYGSLTEAIYDPWQFSSVWDGGIDRHSVPSESTIRICRQELRQPGYPGLWYFRDSYFHSLGKPWGSIDNMFFSTK